LERRLRLLDNEKKKRSEEHCIYTKEDIMRAANGLASVTMTMALLEVALGFR
jgi:hypothetical protein